MVWAEVADIRRHTGWMADAVAIRITSTGESGVGTTFDCETRVGPFRTLDRMVVTEWVEGCRIGISHRGLVTGSGRFLLDDIPSGGTTFTWEEDLSFPRRLGGHLTALVARPVLTILWRRNLRRLARLVGAAPSAP